MLQHLKEKTHGNKAKLGRSADDLTNQSGSDPTVESKFWKIFASAPLVAIMRLACQIQRPFLQTDLGNGYLVVARIGTGLALFFLGVVLVRGIAELPTLDFRSGLLWAGLLGGLVLYCLSQVFGAFAWKAVLLIYGVKQPMWRAESQLLVSQIGKFIPGNVAHLFGRLSLARDDGVAGTIAGAAMLLEIAILLTTGVLITCVLVFVSPDLMSKLTAGLPDHAGTILIALGIVLILVGLVIGQIIVWRRAGRPSPTILQLIMPVALYTANFSLLGVSLWCVSITVSYDAGVLVSQSIAIFTTAWIAGFLMPGAPGGIGVRDGIIALGLELVVGQGAGLGVAVIHRIVSVLGDVIIFDVGLVLRKRT